MSSSLNEALLARDSEDASASNQLRRSSDAAASGALATGASPTRGSADVARSSARLHGATRPAMPSLGQLPQNASMADGSAASESMRTGAIARTGSLAHHRRRPHPPSAFASDWSTSPGSSASNINPNVLRRKLRKAGITNRSAKHWNPEGAGLDRMITFQEVMGDELASADLECMPSSVRVPTPRPAHSPPVSASRANNEAAPAPGSGRTHGNGAPPPSAHPHRRQTASISPLEQEPSDGDRNGDRASVNASANAQSALWTAKRRIKPKHIAQIVFTLLCVLIATAVWYADRVTEGGATMVCRAPLATWCIIAACVFPTIKLCGFAVDALVRVIELACARMENIHWVLIGTSRALRILTSTLVLLGVMRRLMVEHGSGLEYGPLAVLTKACACFVVFALVEVLKTLGCRFLSLRALSPKIFTVLREAVEKEQALQKVLGLIASESSRTDSDRYAAIAQAMHVPAWSVGLYLSKLRASSLTMNSRNLSLTAQITRLIKQFEGLDETEVDEHALRAAEYFWWMSRSDVNSLTLTRDDLRQILDNEDDINAVFELFDDDDDDFLVAEEVQQRFKRIYQERRNVANTLQDTRSVVDTLEGLVGCVLHIIATGCYAAIFGLDIGHMLLSLSSVAIAFAFVFGNSMRTIYESVVFLFVVHPYSVGDRIVFKGEKHIVDNFGLMMTKMIRYDGSMLWVPNEKLMDAELLNISQSINYQDRLVFEVDSRNVTQATLDDLTDRLHSLMQKQDEGSYFDPHFDSFAHIAAVTDPLKYQVGVCYQLNSNIVSFEYLCQARTRVHFVIGQWQLAHHIVHSQSVQPGFMMRHPGDHAGSRQAPFDLSPYNVPGASAPGLAQGSASGGFRSDSLALGSFAPQPVATGQQDGTGAHEAAVLTALA